MLTRIVIVLVLSVLTPLDLPAWADASRRADLSRLVVLGDSLSAGYQNGSLLDRQQGKGYAALVAGQAGVALPLPLIAEPGIPNVLTLVDPGPPPIIEPAPGISPGRVDPTVQAMDLAVPGATVQDALTRRPDLPVDSLTDLVLGLPGLFGGIALSQVEWAEALAPTTVLAWLGNMDALGAVIFGADASLVTPLADFEAAYAELMDRLAATGATLVVANVPDVTVIPYLTPADAAAALVGLPLAVIGPILGIGAGDFVTPEAFPLIAAILADPTLGPLPGSVVLDAGEVAVIRAVIAGFNAVIAAQAAARGAALVDVHGLFEATRATGLVVGGQRLTTGFLGGLFSLDGIHPTDTGYGVLANAVIRQLNTRFAAGIPPVNLWQVAATDPLILPGVGWPPAALGNVSPEAAASVRAGLRR
jgi:lysophospholipase L1-like esterase